MKLNSRGSNCTEVEVEGVTVLFSYSTPVAAHIADVGFFRTCEQFSSTTSKHINGWLRANSASLPQVVLVPQEALAELLTANPGNVECLMIMANDQV